MLETSRSPGDTQRTRPPRDDRGMTTLSRSTSPAAAAVHRSRDTRRESYQAKPRGRSVEKRQQPGGRRRRKSRGRSKERANHPSQSSWPRPRADSRDCARPRGPDSDHPPPSRHHQHPPPLHRGRGDQREEHDGQRAASRSPSFAKRARSPSPSLAGSRPKKSRRHRSPRRPGNGPSKSLHLTKPHRDAPPPSRRPRSPEYRDRYQRPRGRASHSRSLSPDRRIPSRSPVRAGHFSRDQNPLPHHLKRPHRRHRSRSPLPTSPPPPRSRRLSTSPRSSRPPTASDTASRRRPTPDLGPYDGSYPPPRSPRDQRGPKPGGRKGRIRDNQGSSKNFDPTSGANSIEVNMSARGGYRGGYNAPPMQPAYGSRAYSQSSGHATPNSSYHGSPPPQSPFSGNNRAWTNQQPYSPQQ